MVRRSTLINFCAALLCAGSSATAAAGSTRSSNLRKPRSTVLEPTATTFDDNTTPRSRLGKSSSSMASNRRKLAEFASSVNAYSAAYKQAMNDIIDADAEDAAAETTRQPVLLMDKDFCSTTSYKVHINNRDIHQYHCDNATNYHGRNGVILLANPNDYIATNNILPASTQEDSAFSTFTVTFSYHATKMTHGDKFCIDFSTNNGSTWQDEECYEYGVDFENGVWYDDIGVQFDKEDIVGLEESDSLSVRLIGRGSMESEVMFDGMKVVASM